MAEKEVRISDLTADQCGEHLSALIGKVQQPGDATRIADQVLARLVTMVKNGEPNDKQEGAGRSRDSEGGGHSPKLGELDTEK